MTVIKVASEILQFVRELEEYKSKLNEYSKNKVLSEAEYDKTLSKTIILLKNGGEYELDGQKIKNSPVSIIEKIAKGICWKEKLEMDKSDQMARNNLAKIEITKAQLNAYQSINKNLDEI